MSSYFQIKVIDGKQIAEIDLDAFNNILNSQIEQAVRAALKANHPCLFADDDVAIIKDVAAGAKIVKKSILYCLAGGIMFLLGWGIKAVWGTVKLKNGIGG